MNTLHEILLLLLPCGVLGTTTAASASIYLLPCVSTGGVVAAAAFLPG